VPVHRDQLRAQRSVWDNLLSLPEVCTDGLDTKIKSYNRERHVVNEPSSIEVPCDSMLMTAESSCHVSQARLLAIIKHKYSDSVVMPTTQKLIQVILIHLHVSHHPAFIIRLMPHTSSVCHSTASFLSEMFLFTFLLKCDNVMFGYLLLTTVLRIIMITQPVEIFCNVSTPFCTSAIH